MVNRSFEGQLNSRYGLDGMDALIVQLNGSY